MVFQVQCFEANLWETPRRTRGWCAKFVSKRSFLGSSVAVVLQEGRVMTDLGIYVFVGSD